MLFRALLATVVLAGATAAPLTAQSIDPTGHWEGSVETGDTDLQVVVDIRRDAGHLAGTISLPSEKLVGVPLQSIAIDNRTLTFQARHDQRFSGDLSDDGTWIVGNLDIQGMRPAFTLKRAGAPRTDVTPVSAAITRDLAGEWQASLTAGGQSMHVALTLTNHANGTATGLLANNQNGGLRLPVTIVQADRQVTLTIVGPAGSFAGTLDASGTELSGVWTEGARTLSVVFRRPEVTP